MVVPPHDVPDAVVPDAAARDVVVPDTGGHPACNEGTVDLTDPGCDDAADNNARSPLLARDDADGTTDFDAVAGGDLGRSSSTDTTEKCAGGGDECDDGNDNDGRIDYRQSTCTTPGVRLNYGDDQCRGPREISVRI